MINIATKILPKLFEKEVTNLSDKDLLELYGLRIYEKKTDYIFNQAEKELLNRENNDDYLEGKIFLSTINSARLVTYYKTLQNLCDEGVLKLDDNIQKTLDLFKEEYKNRKEEL